MLPFLFLNIIVSAVVVLSILFWWDNRGNALEAAIAATPTTTFAGELPTPNLAAPPPDSAAAEPVAPAAEEPVIHTVQAGETLGRISQQYEVSIQDILAANGLSDPNFISVGQQLTIPVGGLPEPTAEAAVPTEVVELPTPIPTEAVAAGRGQIGVSEVIGVGVPETEAVQIVNSGAELQPMQGWTLRDEDGHVYTFGQVSIFGDGAGVMVHTRAGTDSATDLYWGLSEPAWRSGETLTLWDANGQVVVTLVVP